ncbi:hypothetical protein [Terracidiphilus gabretensis]|uniref:hypothetical protein n=1 Tax=Terracidiphilus gabretensis TaxID=1577687 RepID=UPI00071B94AE|nr:hypothetical protein [Terracidiphilus gabretensis]
MRQPLRPMNLGEILDRTFQIYKSRFWVFVGIAALPALVMIAVRFAMESWWKLDSARGFRVFGLIYMEQVMWMLLLFLIQTLFDFLIRPSMTHLSSGEILHSPCSLSTALRSILNRWLANIGLALFVLCCVIIFPFIVIILLEACSGALAQAARIDTTAFGPIWAPEMATSILLGFVCFFLFSGWFGLSWCACRLEKLAAWQALGRGRRLSRGALRKLLTAQLAQAVLWWSLTFASLIALHFLTRPLRLKYLNHTAVLRAYTILVSSGAFVISSLLGPIYPIALTLIYYDQRIRKEGYDIEQMMQSAGWIAEENVVTPSLPVEAPQG